LQITTVKGRSADPKLAGSTGTSTGTPTAKQRIPRPFHCIAMGRHSTGGGEISHAPNRRRFRTSCRELNPGAKTGTRTGGGSRLSRRGRDSRLRPDRRSGPAFPYIRSHEEKGDHAAAPWRSSKFHLRGKLHRCHGDCLRSLRPPRTPAMRLVSVAQSARRLLVSNAWHGSVEEVLLKVAPQALLAAIRTAGAQGGAWSRNCTCRCETRAARIDSPTRKSPAAVRERTIPLCPAHTNRSKHVDRDQSAGLACISYPDADASADLRADLWTVVRPVSPIALNRRLPRKQRQDDAPPCSCAWSAAQPPEVCDCEPEFQHGRWESVHHRRAELHCRPRLVRSLERLMAKMAAKKRRIFRRWRVARPRPSAGCGDLAPAIAGLREPSEPHERRLPLGSIPPWRREPPCADWRPDSDARARTIPPTILNTRASTPAAGGCRSFLPPSFTVSRSRRAAQCEAQINSEKSECNSTRVAGPQKKEQRG
jgi:hypothetical protein